MDLDLFQMLAEPGQRQAVVAAGGAIFEAGKDLVGVATKLYKNARRANAIREEREAARIEILVADETTIDREDSESQGSLGVIYRFRSIYLPALIGFGASLNNSNPVGGYGLEVVIDGTCAALGVGLVKGVKASTSYLLNRRNYGLKLHK